MKLFYEGEDREVLSDSICFKDFPSESCHRAFPLREAPPINPSAALALVMRISAVNSYVSLILSAYFFELLIHFPGSFLWSPD